MILGRVESEGSVDYIQGLDQQRMGIPKFMYTSEKSDESTKIHLNRVVPVLCSQLTEDRERLAEDAPND
jgi:hypothetical protein